MIAVHKMFAPYPLRRVERPARTEAGLVMHQFSEAERRRRRRLHVQPLAAVLDFCKQTAADLSTAHGFYITPAQVYQQFDDADFRCMVCDIPHSKRHPLRLIHMTPGTSWSSQTLKSVCGFCYSETHRRGGALLNEDQKRGINSAVPAALACVVAALGDQIEAQALQLALEAEEALGIDLGADNLLLAEHFSDLLLQSVKTYLACAKTAPELDIEEAARRLGLGS